jgi:hypothetical protein
MHFHGFDWLDLILLPGHFLRQAPIPTTREALPRLQKFIRRRNDATLHPLNENQVGLNTRCRELVGQTGIPWLAPM